MLWFRSPLCAGLAGAAVRVLKVHADTGAVWSWPYASVWCVELTYALTQDKLCESCPDLQRAEGQPDPIWLDKTEVRACQLSCASLNCTLDVRKINPHQP